MAFRLRLVVTPPFSADHVVDLSAAASPDALNAELMHLDGRKAAWQQRRAGGPVSRVCSTRPDNGGLFLLRGLSDEADQVERRFGRLAVERLDIGVVGENTTLVFLRCRLEAF